MRIPLILAVSLATVLAGSLFLVGPYSISISIPKQDSAQEAEAATLPLMIRDRFSENDLAGDAEAGSRFLKVNEDFVDPENHCEFCTRVEYTPGSQGVAGFSYEDLRGLDLSNAEKASFWVRGEEGDEKITFKLAGKSLDKIEEELGTRPSEPANEIFKNERFALTTEQVTLDDKWKKYEVDLSGVDLREITHPFAFELEGNRGQEQVMFIKGVVYDDTPAVDALATTTEELTGPLSAEINSNATEGTSSSDS